MPPVAQDLDFQPLSSRPQLVEKLMPEQAPQEPPITRGQVIFFLLVALWLFLSVEGWLPTWLRFPVGF